ncbi:MAG: PhnD/SsuA/transferrin family substrate-binding protein, partial [Rhodoferax sp.]|nr:PhnD/SsuA/transferrin family substrate-binding protein [Rhodoferax sp.]
NNSENLEKVKDHLPEKFKDIRIIWTSPLIPLDPLVMRKDLPEATKAKLREFIYSYGQGSQKEKDNLFKLSKLSGFKASSNNQLTPIRHLELFKSRNKLEADANLADAEKQVKLADIDKQLSALSLAK